MGDDWFEHNCRKACRKMWTAWLYGFGALGSLELFLLLHGSSVNKVLAAMGAG